MILRIDVRARYRYLWLKGVAGFNPAVHCARCLKGSFHPGLSASGASAGDQFTLDVDLDAAPIHYLCGVTSKWETNLHIPFRSAPGRAPFAIEGWNIRIEFPEGGIEVLPIGAVVPGVDPAFGTCRNWIFGRQYFS